MGKLAVSLERLFHSQEGQGIFSSKSSGSSPKGGAQQQRWTKAGRGPAAEAANRVGVPSGFQVEPEGSGKFRSLMVFTREHREAVGLQFSAAGWPEAWPALFLSRLPIGTCQTQASLEEVLLILNYGATEVMALIKPCRNRIINQLSLEMVIRAYHPLLDVAPFRIQPVILLRTEGRKRQLGRK